MAEHIRKRLESLTAKLGQASERHTPYANLRESTLVSIKANGGPAAVRPYRRVPCNTWRTPCREP